MRTRRTAALVIMAGLCLGLVATAWAHEPQAGKKGNNIGADPKDVPVSESTKQLNDLELAWQLVSYGRKNNNAESLLLAAKIIHVTPSQLLKSGFTTKGPKGESKSKGGTGTASATDLIAEAKKMASSPHLDSMIKATEKYIQETVRGAVGGPRTDSFTIMAGETIEWVPIDFKANELAVVHYNIGVHGKMILDVFDENNNLIRTDSVPGNFYRCEWVPKWQGPFRFRLTNIDTISFKCSMATN